MIVSENSTPLPKNKELFPKFFTQIKDPKKLYHLLKTHPNYSIFRENLEFMVNPDALPFVQAYKFEYVEMLTRHKQNYPNRTWAELFKERREFLRNQIDHYRDLTLNEEEKCLESDPRARLYSLKENILKGNVKLELINAGASGAFYCIEDSNVVAVLKSVNADASTIDNINGVCSPLPSTTCRDCENYLSCQREALAYEIALELGLREIVPPTILTIIDSEKFPTFFDNQGVVRTFEFFPLIKESIFEALGKPSTERLCSLQVFVPHTYSLTQVLQNFGSDKFPNLLFDDENFENTIHLTRILAETDGHTDNYLVTLYEDRYFLIKIDSGFSFPRKNEKVTNALTSLPNARKQISDHYIRLVMRTDTEKVIALAEKFGLDAQSIEATKTRLEFLKKLVSMYPKITHREVELRLRLFSGTIYNKSETARLEFALKAFTPVELKQLKARNRSYYLVRDTHIPSFRVTPGGLFPIAVPFRKSRVLLLTSQSNEESVDSDDSLGYTGYFG